MVFPGLTALAERSLTRFRGWSRPVRDGLEEIPMQEPGLDNRHRDKNGEISKKHGNTLISTLRQTYGQGFASGQPDDKKLSEILHELDVEFAEPARQRPAAAPICVTQHFEKAGRCDHFFRAKIVCPLWVIGHVTRQCPLWVKSGYLQCKKACPLCPRKWTYRKNYYREISFSHSSSVSTFTPCFLASASFEPAPGPATT